MTDPYISILEEALTDARENKLSGLILISIDAEEGCTYYLNGAFHLASLVAIFARIAKEIQESGRPEPPEVLN